MTKRLPVAELLELPVSERIKQVERIRDAIAAAPNAILLSNDIKSELDQRLAEFEAQPNAGAPWKEVRERLLARRWRAD